MSAVPFIHKFASLDKKKNFIYCANTERLLEVDKILYDVIDYGGEIREDVPGRILKIYDKRLLKKANEQIKMLKENIGFAGESRPKEMVLHISEKEYHEKIENYMGSMTLNLTNLCNLRCTYCSYGPLFKTPRKNAATIMTIDTAKRAIDLLMKNSGPRKILYLGFYGGEPFLNIKVMQESTEYFMKKCESHNIDKCNVSLTTNGTAINRETMKWLVKNNIGLLVSMDGPKDIHDRYRKYKNGKGSHDMVIRTLHEIRDYDEEYYSRIRFNVVCAPPIEFKKLFEYFANNLGLFKSNIRFGDLHYDDKGYFRKISNEYYKYHREGQQYLFKKYFNLLSKESVNEDLIKILENMLDHEFIRIANRKIRKTCEDTIVSQICEPGVHKCFVSTDGAVFPCERVNECEYLEIGNVYDGFYRVNGSLKGFKLIEAFYELFKNKCTRCWAFRYCSLNTCFNAVCEDNGFTEERLRRACHNKQKDLENKLRHYLYYEEKYPEIFKTFCERPL